jgi:NAD(P)-dependent dehydrogenase (short-subunit alcohol dehydrogenase family)
MASATAPRRTWTPAGRFLYTRDEPYYMPPKAVQGHDSMKRVLLIGASGGVGQAVAKRLLDSGYEVWGSAHDALDLERTQREVPSLRHGFVADFSNANTGRAQLAVALSQSSAPLVAVIGCAGISSLGPLETAPLDDLRRIMEVNVLGNLAAYQVAIPYLRETTGRFIFLSSFLGKVGSPLMGLYVASKHALEGLADVMRLEAGQWGIPVSLIEPGGIKTPMLSAFNDSLAVRLQNMGEEERRNYGPYFEQFKQFSANSEDELLTPDDAANTILQVLEAVHPKPRYVLGNAVDLLEQRRVSSDEDMDALWRSLLPGNGNHASNGKKDIV